MTTPADLVLTQIPVFWPRHSLPPRGQPKAIGSGIHDWLARLEITTEV
jgi:hypothetical protein